LISRITVSFLQNVGAEFERQGFALVDRWNTRWAAQRNASVLEFPTQCSGVSGFQKPGTTMAMQLNRQSDDTFSQFLMV